MTDDNAQPSRRAATRTASIAGANNTLCLVRPVVMITDRVDRFGSNGNDTGCYYNRDSRSEADLDCGGVNGYAQDTTLIHASSELRALLTPYLAWSRLHILKTMMKAAARYEEDSALETSP
jgi:hypothetical protein